MVAQYQPKVTVHNKEEWLRIVSELYKGEEVAHGLFYHLDNCQVVFTPSVLKALDAIPEHLFPIKMKVTNTPIHPTEEDLLTWKRLYEEAGLIEDDIARITGWTSATVRRGLHKLNVKTTRKRREYRGSY